MSDNKSTCLSCGYEWLTGTDGSHSCSSEMSKTIETLKGELKLKIEVAESRRKIITSLKKKYAHEVVGDGDYCKECEFSYKDIIHNATWIREAK